MINSESVHINRIMKNIFLPAKVSIVVIFLLLSTVKAQSNYLDEGIMLFNKKEFEKSKILFEKDLVFNPKSEKSYLYLAKIFNQNNNEEEEEINLKNVLLLNPQNDEAIYMLTLLKIKQSDYNEAKELINTFSLVCKSFWSIKKEIEDKLDKLIPENAKNND